MMFISWNKRLCILFSGIFSLYKRLKINQSLTFYLLYRLVNDRNELDEHEL